MAYALHESYLACFRGDRVRDRLSGLRELSLGPARLARGQYVRPYRYSSFGEQKEFTLTVTRGELGVILFHKGGELVQVVRLGPDSETTLLPQDVFRTYVSLSEETEFIENVLQPGTKQFKSMPESSVNRSWQVSYWENYFLSLPVRPDLRLVPTRERKSSVRRRRRQKKLCSVPKRSHCEKTGKEPLTLTDLLRTVLLALIAIMTLGGLGRYKDAKKLRF